MDERYSVEDFLRMFGEILFIKPKKFIGDNEYRFVLNLNDGEILMPPRVMHVMLSLNALNGIVDNA